ncbi:hypothetical protein FRB96_004398 [Tulasnella sp. 330]|nr:hypothetical protein FRB96_004398 [Tulasnella sp. 330]KAG8884535.1 hypothetical protein FRB97_004048 [Tulasnella sp. 331]KAG8889465.1 hypothetical protein FRB98_004150 [Tulasnella sp. 332]
MIKRRLGVDERAEVRAGNIYIWEERSADEEAVGMGMERWTDGLQWGPSRTREEFLFYLQKPPDEDGVISRRGKGVLKHGKRPKTVADEEKRANRRRSQPVPQRIHSDVNLSAHTLLTTTTPATTTDVGTAAAAGSSSAATSPTLTTGPVGPPALGPYSSFGPPTLNSTTTVGEHQLVKQTYSVYTRLPSDPESKPMRKWHLTAYYTTHAVHTGLLRDISSDPRLASIPVPPEAMFVAARTTPRPRGPQNNDSSTNLSRNYSGVLPSTPHGYQSTTSTTTAVRPVGGEPMMYNAQGGSSSSSATSSPIVEFSAGGGSEMNRQQAVASGSGSGSAQLRQHPYRQQPPHQSQQQQQQQHWSQNQYASTQQTWANPSHSHPHSPLTGPSSSSSAHSPHYHPILPPPPNGSPNQNHSMQYSYTHSTYNPLSTHRDARCPDSQLRVRTQTPPEPWAHQQHPPGQGQGHGGHHSAYPSAPGPAHHESQPHRGAHQRWPSTSAAVGIHGDRPRVTSLPMPGAPSRQYAAYPEASPMREPEMMQVEQPEAGPSYSQHQYQQQYHQVRPRPPIITTRHDTPRSPSPALPSPSSSHHSGGSDDDAMMIDTASVHAAGSPLPNRGLTTLADNRALPPLDFSTIRIPFPTRTAEDERALWRLNKSFHNVAKNG